MNDIFSAVIKSDVLLVEETVGKALEFLKGVSPELSENALFETRLIISEALVNAVKHGNEGDTDKSVSLAINVRNRRLIMIQISDEGKGFDHSKVMKRKHDLASAMKESGRGVRLVCLLSDKVVYNKKGNRLKIYKKVVVDE